MLKHLEGFTVKRLHVLLARLEANPVTARLLRRLDRPSARDVIGIAVGIGLSSAALGVVAWLAGAEIVLNLLLVAALILLLFAPLIVGPAAATLTAQSIHEGQHELLILTHLPDEKLAQGYVYAALYWTRGLLAVTAGLTPLVVLKAFLEFLVRPYLVESPWRAFSNPASILALGAVLGGVIFFLLGAWGMVMAAAALGTAVALRWRREYPAAGLAALAVVVGGPALALALTALFYLTGPWGVGIAWTLTPYLLWQAGLDAARRWARRTA